MSTAPLFVISLLVTVGQTNSADQDFARLSATYLDVIPALTPVSATALGDHRFDGQLDEVNPAARDRKLKKYRELLSRLEGIPRAQLSRPNQVDHSLLTNDLRRRVWELEVLREWAWNPLVYTELAGGSVYGLMARDFAPLPRRLGHVADRLEQFPRMFREIRATLEPSLVPRIHAETAVKQNRGVLSIVESMVRPHLEKLSAVEGRRMLAAIEGAKQAVDEHQKWLESELLPLAQGDFRIGAEKYDEKLRFTLHSSLTRDQIRDRAISELRRVREKMFQLSKQVYTKAYPYTRFPERPSAAFQQAVIRAGLEMAYRDTPEKGQILNTAKESLAITTEFVRTKQLITIPPDPVEIIVMPEFQRGVSLAYCDSPGPLDVGQKTFYAVSPLPKQWNRQQVDSFLREYNVRSVHNLTVHEAMPGHFVQLAHSNRYPGKLRAVLASGTFIEGWAVYTEQMMAEEGFLDNDPLMHLIALKWYLRGIANAILDQALHTSGISREEAMRLMMESTFQEEREAAGKWVRAQLTSAQLSTYFVGYLEHQDLRQEMERVRGADFQLKEYHDNVLSHGSPPVRFVRALLLKQPIPE